jgi:hypothetical protein
MKSTFALILLSVSPLAYAASHETAFHQQGTIAEMTAVNCGVDEKSGKSFVGELIGTDSGHKKSREALCQEYVLKTDQVVYRIRPRDEKHPVLLPVGERAEFHVKKDKLLLSVPELDSREREYSVVSMRLAEKSPQADGERVAQVPGPQIH